MKSDYSRDIFKQLQETMKRLDKMESTLENTKIEHEIEIGHLNDKIDSLEKENAALKIENARLKDDNERLRRIINNDSTNSSLPPSSDEKPAKAANEFNHRNKTKKKQGAQKGHKGTTLTKAKVKEQIEKGAYDVKIKEIGKRSEHYVTRYVLDLQTRPVATEVRIYVDENGKYNIPKEYNSEVTYGDTIKALSVLLYSEGVVANDRIAEVINAISNNTLNISSGTVYNFCASFSELSEESRKQIENDLLNSAVLYTDGTVVTENGKQAIIRNVSNKKSVMYTALENKKISAMKASVLWSEFLGVFVHDHETALYHFGTDHGECNVHLERYLMKNSEESKNSWSNDMIHFLSGINHAKKKRIAQGDSVFTKEQLDSYSKRYNEILNCGYEQNKKTKGKYAKSEEKKLLNRLKKYKKNHLLFAYKFEVEYSNNMSERDLRKCKNREKMSGGFRTSKGREMFCNILSIIETLKRRKMNIIENIMRIFQKDPAIF